ncbi:hypothetical protein [Bacillus luti]
MCTKKAARSFVVVALSLFVLLAKSIFFAASSLRINRQTKEDHNAKEL